LTVLMTPYKLVARLYVKSSSELRSGDRVGVRVCVR
jgi:hypothetical protein